MRLREACHRHKDAVLNFMRPVGQSQCGKWHLGSDPTGFDRWIVLPGQGVYWNPDFLVPGKRLTIQGHVTGIITELGIEFIETRPREKPFFLMLPNRKQGRRAKKAEK